MESPLRKVGSGRNNASVLTVGLGNEAMGLVRETLSAEAALPDKPIGFGDALQAAKRARPDTIIVGFDESVEAALALAEALGRESHATLVALASKSNAETILAAMRVGYKEFVVLPDDATRLRAVVKESAYSAGDDQEDSGLVVSVFGAKGGVGTTTLTTHLGAELAAIHRVVCIDNDFVMGDVASILDITPKDTMADVLPRAEKMDERMLTGACAVHRSKLHVLAQASELEKTGEPNADDVYNIIRAAAKGYMYVLLDCGAQLEATSMTAISVSDVILFIVTPDVIAVRDAFRRMKQLEAHGIEPDRLKLIVNRQRKNAYISLTDIENSLQIKVAATVADDPETVDKAVNEGQLIRDVNRKADVTRDISRLVALLVDDDGGAAPEPEDKKGGWFSGLFGGR
jgi:pilus assembly protein CpaE